jgi:molybdenum cofactor cytidylyltransferase
MNTVCVLLAAGSSSRMQPGFINQSDDKTAGVAKMLLEINGKTLLQHVIDEVKQVPDTFLLVVTGCYHNQLSKILTSQQISFVYNEQWKEGMGTSIQKAITYIDECFSKADQAMTLVCDQPYISSTLLKKIIGTSLATGKGIVACKYNDTIGTPVLFDKKYFNQLKNLQGQQGAKKVVEQFKDDVALVDFPEGVIDIDTPDDYHKLKR